MNASKESGAESRVSRKVAVVGSHGFIGSAVCDYLARSGDPAIEFNSLNPLILQPFLQFNEILEADVILWAASKVNPWVAKTSPHLIQEELNNWADFLNYLTAHHIQVRPLIIFLSSGGCVYDSGEPPYQETDPANGINEYGQMKLAMEEMLRDSGLRHVILRVSNVYGPNQPAGRGQGVIAEWVYAAQNSKSARVYGNLRSERDYLYISDLCQAIMNAMDSELSQTINIGSGVGTSLQTIINLLSDNFDPNLQFELGEARAFDRDNYWLNIGRAEVELGWKPIVDIEEGLKRILQSL